MRADRGSGQETKQVHEVTALTNDPAAALGLALCPVIWRNLAGIHCHDKDLGLRRRCKQLADTDHMRRESAVKANHHHWIESTVNRGHVRHYDVVELVSGDR